MQQSCSYLQESLNLLKHRRNLWHCDTCMINNKDNNNNNLAVDGWNNKAPLEINIASYASKKCWRKKTDIFLVNSKSTWTYPNEAHCGKKFKCSILKGKKLISIFIGQNESEAPMAKYGTHYNSFRSTKTAVREMEQKETKWSALC